jgi:hypothetical protein
MNDRTITGIIIPVERSDAIVYVTGTLATLRKHANIEFGERVNTFNGRTHKFVAMVDSDGADKGYKLNSRAVILTGYPGRLLGDVLLFSEAIVEDEDGIPGIDYVNVDEGVMPWINENLAILIADFMAKHK